MPFDAQAPAEVTARDQMIVLRDFLVRIEDRQFNISYLWSKDGRVADEDEVGVAVCGTAACIQGWYSLLFHTHDRSWVGRRGAWERLCLPHYSDGPSKDRDWYTRARAIRVLDHLIETGEVDWSVAK